MNTFKKNPELVSKFKGLDTTCVSDAMDRLGIECCLQDIKPINSGTTLCGQAFTVKYLPVGAQPPKGVGDFVEMVGEGEVIVIDNDGRTNATVWGDLMTIYASTNNIGGTLINGVCRDLPTIKKIGYPIFTKGYNMRTGKDRVDFQAANIPVQISGILINPGDIIVGDDTGALVVPYEKAEEVVSIAQEIADKEEKIIEQMKRGASLKEARAAVSYHTLQTKIEKN